jgi:DNA-binding MarR family transcriptional regulator
MSKQVEKDSQPLLEEMNLAGRAFSDANIRFHQLVAQKAGLASGDHKYLGIIMQHPSITAGELAKLSGLTTGPVTWLIDRLEKKNLVSRQRDAKDRRKVIIVANSKTIEKLLGPIFQLLVDRLTKVNNEFSEQSQQIIIEYMNKTGEAIETLIEELLKKSV